MTGLEQIKGLSIELIEMHKELVFADYKAKIEQYDLKPFIQTALYDAFEEGYDTGAKGTLESLSEVLSVADVFKNAQN